MIDLYASHKILVWLLFIIAPIAACLAYEFGWRRNQPHSGGFGPPYVSRFGRREIITHWLCMVLGTFLIGTGIYQIIVNRAGSHIGTWHECVGYVLGIVCLIKLFSWARDCRFHVYDWAWFKVMGGYLSKSSMILPAGRFNAGQKVYFWLINALVIILFISAIIMEQHSHGAANRMGAVWAVHGLAGCLFTAAVIGHAYLSLFINSATARVLLDGKISLPYLREHHSRIEF